MLDGVVVTKLKKIPDERGAIYHMLRNDDKHFQKFGEIYFSLKSSFQSKYEKLAERTYRLGLSPSGRCDSNCL